MTQRAITKFYNSVGVAPQDGGFAVHLDGKPVKTLSRNVLLLPNKALAEAIASEWREQKERVNRASMPLTSMAGATIDISSARRAEVIAHIVSFARSDLLCYRTDTPAELARRHSGGWDPLLDWLADTHGARLRHAAGVSFVEQSTDALEALEAFVSRLDGWRLVALDKAVGLTGSLVVSLALVARRLTADEAFAAAHLDELYQAEKWGVDREAELRLCAIREELRAVELFLGLLE